MPKSNTKVSLPPPPVTVCTLPLAARGVVGRGFAQRRNGLIARRPGQLLARCGGFVVPGAHLCAIFGSHHAGEGCHDAVIAGDDEGQVVDDVVDQHQGLALTVFQAPSEELSASDQYQAALEHVSPDVLAEPAP